MLAQGISLAKINYKPVQFQFLKKTVPSVHKRFDYLSEWICPLEKEKEITPPKKWVFKII